LPHFLQEYYSTLLGPNIEVLQIELEAAGIAKKQRDAVRMLFKQTYERS